MMFRFIIILFSFAAIIGPSAVFAAEHPQLGLIQPSEDGSHFVNTESDETFRVWGVNYDRDDAHRLIEDYWHEEWPTVVHDFREMKALGANVVRVHLQFVKFMESPSKANEAELKQLAQLLRLAEETGLYLNITGLGCYHRADVPRWYAEMDEPERWAAQAVFWEAVAKTCAGSDAFFAMI